MAKDISAIVQKQIRRLESAGDDIRAGVAAVQVAPGKLAADNVDRYKAGIERSIDKWKANVASVSLSSWQDSMTTKGIPRIAEGIRGASDKLTQFHTQLANYQSSYLPALNKKKVLSLSDAISKMAANVEAMAKFRFVRK